MTVYAIHALGTDFVKIGFVGRDVPGRRDQLQTGCPFQLWILATIDDGVLGDERRLQLQLQSKQVRGEWFHLDEQQREDLAVLFALWTERRRPDISIAPWLLAEPSREPSPFLMAGQRQQNPPLTRAERDVVKAAIAKTGRGLEADDDVNDSSVLNLPFTPPPAPRSTPATLTPFVPLKERLEIYRAEARAAVTRRRAAGLCASPTYARSSPRGRAERKKNDPG